MHHDSSFTAAPILMVLFLIDDQIQINMFSALWFPESCQTLKYGLQYVGMLCYEASLDPKCIARVLVISAKSKVAIPTVGSTHLVFGHCLGSLERDHES